MQSTFPSNRGNRAFNASRLSPWMIMLPQSEPVESMTPLLGHALEHTVGHVPVVVDDLLLAHPVQCGHVRTRPCLS